MRRAGVLTRAVAHRVERTLQHQAARWLAVTPSAHWGSSWSRPAIGNGNTVLGLSIYQCVAAGEPKTTERERCDGARVRPNTCSLGAEVDTILAIPVMSIILLKYCVVFYDYYSTLPCTRTVVSEVFIRGPRTESHGGEYTKAKATWKDM